VFNTKRGELVLLLACTVSLGALAHSALAANGGSACPTTINTPNSNPTVATCPGGNCWGPNSKCWTLTSNRSSDGPCTEWAWDPATKTWKVTGGTYTPGPNVNVVFCVCLIGADPSTFAGHECCRCGVVTDAVGRKHVVTMGQCGIPNCPPGTCSVSQTAADPENPDQDITEDCK